MITFNATQQSIADATSKTVSWLFAVNDGTARYWSSKEYTYSAQAYDNRVIPESFDGITLSSSFSNNGIICPSTLEFQVADPAAAFTAANFVDKELTVSLVEDDGTNETIMAVWKFRVKTCYKRSKKLYFECEDYFTTYLKGQYPNTPLISAFSPSDSDNTDDNMCVPIIFGTAYIPCRSVYITDQRYYLMGAAGHTYTITESRTPLDWSSVSVWDNSYTYTQSSHTLDGVSYQFVKPIITDSDGDGTADSMGLFYDSTFHDIQLKMSRDDTVSLTDYADVIHYILEDFGIPSANIDDTVFAAAKVIYTAWGITFNGGFFAKEDRTAIIAQILHECHSVIKQTAEGKLGLYPLVKASQATLSTDDIRKSAEIGETTLSYREGIETEYDSAYVSYCNGGPQGILIKTRVEANGTSASISDDTLEMPHLNGTVKPQAMGELYFQRAYGNAGNITADLRDDYVALQPDDLITINNALYGPSMTAIIEQIHISRDLTTSIEAMKCRWTIDDFTDLAPSVVTIITDDSTSVWSPVIQGDDDAEGTNSITARVRIGESIWLDGVAETIIVGATEGILIDGANTRVRSSNYVSGYLGAGFTLEPDLLEVGNIRARGGIYGATFVKNSISAMGGDFLVSIGADVLAVDMTALDSCLMTIKGDDTFAVGDMLNAKSGTYEEWFEVTAAGEETAIDSYSESNNSTDYAIGYSTPATDTLMDSYASSNQDNDSLLYTGYVIERGQTFTGNGESITKVSFYIKKVGSPTGTLNAAIYTHTGTWGTSGLPTGAALETSATVDVATGITTSYQVITFTLSSPEATVNGTHYVATLQFTSTSSDASNYVSIGLDASSPSHGGNGVYYAIATSEWLASANDRIFYVYYTVAAGTPTSIRGQSITGNGEDLTKASFYLKKTGSPTGSAYAKLYAHSGTFGTSSIATGAALATSDAFDVSTLTTNLAITDFTFSSPYTTVDTTNYVVTIEYAGNSSTDYIVAGGDSSSPTHGGNACAYVSSYTAYSGVDLCFYAHYNDTSSGVYTVTRDKFAAYAANSNPAWTKGTTIVNYGASGDGGIYFTASGPYLSMFTHAGSPWSTITTELRIGNLNGSYGYSAATYGIGLGKYANDNVFLLSDPTNGIRIRRRTSGADTTIGRWATTGALTLYDSAGARRIEVNTGGVYAGDMDTGYYTRIYGSGMLVYVNSVVVAQYGSNVVIGQIASGQNNVYISSGAMYFRNNTTNLISITNAGVASLNLLAGSDIIINGHDTNPAKLIFRSIYDVEFYMPASSSTMHWVPNSGGIGNLGILIGDTTNYWNYIYLYANNVISTRSRIDSDTYASMDVDADGGTNPTAVMIGRYNTYTYANVYARGDASAPDGGIAVYFDSNDYALITVTGANNASAITFTADANGTVRSMGYNTTGLVPSTDRGISLGYGTSYQWDQLWVYNVNEEADFFFLDDRDDLAELAKIKGSGKYDPISGLEFIDDNTLPEWALVKAAEDMYNPFTKELMWKKGDIMKSSRGNPSMSSKIWPSWLRGSIIQEDKKVMALKEAFEKHLQDYHGM